MSYLIIARKWRPQKFEDIIGQEHIVKVLQNAIKLDRVSHAYLFAGPRGIGKTTTARVLAKALNCAKGATPTPCLRCINCEEIAKGMSLDVLEIDGASNRGIEQVRDLRENAKLKPAQSRFKIYIIDEVHMLTEPAFNALLKILEEPPEHVKFIFATTQPNKVPATILSRCQKFDFKPLAVSIIEEKLFQILKEENIKFQQEAVAVIAKAADGSLRDAESLLDQFICVSQNSGIDIEVVNRFLGTINVDVLHQFVQALIESDSRNSLLALERLVSEGKDISNIIESLIRHFRSIMLVKILHPDEIPVLSGDNMDKIEQQGRQLSKEEILFILDLLTDIQNKMRYSFSPRILMELGILKICSRVKYQISISSANEEREKPDELPEINTEVKQNIKAPQTGENEIVKSKNNEDMDEKKSPNLIQEATRIWPEVVDIIKQKKMSLASCLLNAKVADFKNGALILEVNTASKLHYEMLEDRDNKKLIEDILCDKLARKIALKCQLNKLVPAEGKNKVQEILKNPKLKKISRMLNAKILKVIPENEN